MKYTSLGVNNCLSMVLVIVLSGCALPSLVDKHGRKEEMNDIVELARAWLDTFAEGDFEAFPGEVAEDFKLRIPFLPPGLQNEFVGREAARAVLVASSQARTKLVFEDVVILRTEDPELVVITANAHATMNDGGIYRNEYIMLTRIRDGVVTEHTEYLNPLALTQSMTETERRK